jgi:hypothetical protein
MVSISVISAFWTLGQGALESSILLQGLIIVQLALYIKA